MADNTDHTTQNATSNEPDLNKFEKVGGRVADCSTGFHDFQFDAMDVGSGGDTALMMKCVFCGLKQTVEAPLNVNNIIEKRNTDVSVMQQQSGETPARTVQPIPQNIPQPAMPVTGGDDIMKKLFGR